MFFARILLTAVALIQGLMTAGIDLGKTHATNPLWIGHARFHTVWQVWNCCILALIELWLLWGSGPTTSWHLNLALILTAVPCAGFLGARAFRTSYGGTLRDPNGIPPIRLRVGGWELCWDGNTVAVCSASVVLGVCAILFNWNALARNLG